MKEFTEEELTQYNGKSGNPAYVAYKGKVYNLSSSFLWREGTHQVTHKAGVDLTDAFDYAPHGEDVFEKFHIIGTLHKSSRTNDRLNREAAQRKTR